MVLLLAKPNIQTRKSAAATNPRGLLMMWAPGMGGDTVMTMSLETRRALLHERRTIRLVGRCQISILLPIYRILS